ncbi:hypothetical protein M407DRAFT_11055 [Tulasnella calospora MUT 4182]|uniref:Uncharacterized protein n=1 Tax=Tulasnella calospora MUT 4182 TaxID=1051891 RepID=A0A0C3Q8M8_9AGAM|nr:hypothetical protein M407DRAFT_11055 [Tulasnella calospora MUT 4182]
MNLPTLDSLQTTVSGISLYAVLPSSERAQNYNMGYRGPPPSPNSKTISTYRIGQALSKDESLDLLVNPFDMEVHRVQAVWISSLARDICQQLNKTVTEQEKMYIKPPDHDGPGRYEARFRRNGRTFTVLDTYTERGIEVPVDNSKPVSEIVTQIANRQRLDFIRGNLNNRGSIPARHPEYAIIADHREMAERAGDDSPYYWMRLEWLLHDFNIAHFVNWSSTIYNRIRSELYLALPTLMDNANVHGSDQITGNRLSISMGEPNVWHIEDRYLESAIKEVPNYWNSRNEGLREKVSLIPIRIPILGYLRGSVGALGRTLVDETGSIALLTLDLP